MANDSPRKHKRSGSSSRWLLRAASVAMLVAVLGGFFGSIHPVIDLISHYQVHMLFGGLTLLGLIALRKDRKAGVLVTLLCTVTALRLAPFWIADEPRIEGFTLRVMSANVQAQNPYTRPFLDEVERVSPDVIAVIEVTERWARAVEPLQQEYPFTITSRSQDDRKYGVTILSRYEIEPIPLSPELGALAFRGAAATVQTPAGPVRVVAVHPRPPTGIAASRQRDAQLTLVNELVRQFQANEPTIVLGDINATPWSHGYRLLIKGTTLRNTRRGSGIMGSWHSAIPSALRIPIDHILVNDPVGVSAIELGTDIGSDHLPVIADLVIPQAVRVSDSDPAR